MPELKTEVMKISKSFILAIIVIACSAMLSSCATHSAQAYDSHRSCGAYN